MAKSVSLFERLSGKKAARLTVLIPVSSDVVEAVSSANQRVARESILGTDASRAEAKTALAAAQTRLREESVRIVVQAIPRADWDALQRANPASTEQQDEAKTQGGYAPWNHDTFLPAAWEACQVPPEGEPPLSYEQCAQLVKGWSNGEQAALLSAIRDVNQSTVSVEALGE